MHNHFYCKKIERKFNSKVMKIKLESIRENPTNLLRRAGYIFQRQEGGKMSFVRALGRSGYPRFHIYTESEGNSLVINLHLDQKKETYGQATRHHGEYENSKVVEEEAERIKSFFI
jgi:hypothetical protein